MKDNTYKLMDGDFSPGCRSTWKSCHTTEHLFIGVRCFDPDMANTIDDFLALHDCDLLDLQLETRSLWPAFRFYVTPGGKTTQRVCDESVWDSSVFKGGDYWSVIFRFPIATLKKYGFNGRELRMNITRSKPGIDKNCHIIQQSWQPKKMVFSHLPYNSDNPSNFGRLVFQN